ncbi:MAG: ankyrin repeat domain-containing protein [Sedimentibacter saalensis]|uniref:M48 family metallopeptidase n=1 Tax=Sedimentibacter saalensis TaxID=130788 RepID=UPI002B21EC50|nr:ankyrin repeat domain-containing protein [Sedimentibacter saalensis]MEA5094299.1 ankyrin repeat domain-containing protein [Sedimentibacter saalensis]
MTKELSLKNLIHKDEKRYFSVALIVSIIIYVSLLFYLEGLGVLLLLTAISLFSNGLMIARIRTNGVRLSANQFPEVYNKVVELCNSMEIQSIPEVYVIESGGILNAFAAKSFRKNIVILYSDIFDLINTENNDELSFIIAHELAHIKRRHVAKHLFILPAMWIPSLGNAYLRACEYTSDRIAAYYINNSEASMNALTILAIGKTLFNKVNRDEYLLQHSKNKGLFNKLAEKSSTHPSLPKRIYEIKYYFENNFNPIEKNFKKILSSSMIVLVVGIIAFIVIKYNNNIMMAADNFLSDTLAEGDATAITEAVAESDVERVNELLNDGMYADVQDMDGWTPLMWAAQDGDVEIMNVLIQAGADPNMVDYYEETALIRAIYSQNVEAINLLLLSGADPNMADSSGWTPLMYAAANGVIEPVEALLNGGADPELKDANNFSAFLYAKKYGYNDIADLLKQQ